MADTSTRGQGASRRLRSAEREGLTLAGFADLLVQLGATEALNMDGGISAAFRAQLGEDVWSVEAGNGTINAVRIRPNPAK
ncbi:MAG: phosphodiester glycosidase family protein [Myxococcota bacterium]